MCINFIYISTVTTGFYREIITGVCGPSVTKDQLSLRFLTNELGAIDLYDGRFCIIKVYEV
jgi:hypothetical protein